MISNRKHENEIEKIIIDFHFQIKEKERAHIKKITDYERKINDFTNSFNSTVNRYIQEIKSLNSRIGGYKKSNNEYQKSLKLLKEEIRNINSDYIKLSEISSHFELENKKLKNDILDLSTRLREQIAIVENYNKCFERKFKFSKKEEIINYDRKNK